MSTIISQYNPSICIPRAYKSISKNKIIQVFQKHLQIGIIKKIIIINTNDNNFKKVFIHFDFWNSNENADNIKELINNNNVIKIVYEFPWFWKCLLYKHT
jgi:hypothetical protein